MSAYIDDELGPIEMDEMRDHMLDCPGCSALEVQLRRIVSSLRRTATRQHDELAVARVTEQWRNKNA